MHTFRARPLTWLFFIATACLDAIALATDNESDFANSLALGQLFIASGWLVVGSSHRLIRGAIFVTAIGLIAAPDFFIPHLRGGFYADLVWPHVLGMLIAMGLATVVETFLWLAMARLTSRGCSVFQRSDWQFPVVELFGWTIIVAVASVGARIADFSLMANPREIGLGLAVTSLAGAIMALTLGDYNEGRRVRGKLVAVMAAAIITLHVVVLAKALPADAQAVAVGSVVYATWWATVLRLDSQRRNIARPSWPGEGSSAQDGPAI